MTYANTVDTPTDISIRHDHQGVGIQRRGCACGREMVLCGCRHRIRWNDRERPLERGLRNASNQHERSSLVLTDKTYRNTGFSSIPSIQ